MKKLTEIWLICMVALIAATVALYRIAELKGFTTGNWLAITVFIEVIAGILVYCWLVPKKLKEAITEETKRAIWMRSIIVITAAGLLLLLLIDKIDVGQGINILVLLGLMLITAEYARQTTIMAKEMKEQRYAESLPILIPEFPPNLLSGSDTYAFLQGGIDVLWHNVGKGAAINSGFSLWGIQPSGEARHFIAPESQALGSGQQILTSFDFYSTEKDKLEQYQPRLEAEYQDIYERKITTVQEFHINEEAKMAFFKDLYFTVNGKRLGKEITQP